MSDPVQMSALEKYFQTGLTSLSIALLAWMGKSQYETSITLTALQVEVRNLNEKLEIATSDRYTSADAGRDFALRDAKIIELERRVSQLEN